jgi:SAM-dependent methyltransferase
MSEFKLKLNNDTEINLFIDDGIFTPTGTTSLLIESVVKEVGSSKSGSILDLGCGCGAVAISLYKLGYSESGIFASDISKNVVDCVLFNSNKNDCYIDVRYGSLFEPWKGCKFDTIIDDISGVSEKVASLSDWFNGVSCESGIDGDILTNKVIKDSKKYLYDGGALYFPIISFSNVNSILKTANKYYNNIQCVGRSEWILPKSMEHDIPILKELKNDGHIDFEERFGTIVWYTEIYKAY